MLQYKNHVLVALALVGLAAGAWQPLRAEDIVLRLEPASIVQTPAQLPPVRVEVTDLRDRINLERTAYQWSLGRIELQPSALALVEEIVAAEAGLTLSQQPGAEPPGVIYCGLREFTIETPNTLAYWDIHTRIALVLRIDTAEREVKASARSRTWVYPRKTLIEQVTRDALKDLAANLAPALADLMAPPSSP